MKHHGHRLSIRSMMNVVLSQKRRPLDEKAGNLVKTDQVIKPPPASTPATGNQSYLEPRHDGLGDQRPHTTIKTLPKSSPSNDVSNGIVGLSRDPQNAHEQAPRSSPADEPYLTNPCLTGDIVSDLEPNRVGNAENETSNKTTDSSVSRSPSLGDFSTPEHSLPSSSVVDEVMIDLNTPSKEAVYPFNSSGLLVGFPHKVEPSAALQTRWTDEIEPRLCPDIEAFQRTTKPVIRKGRVIMPRLSVELRMSGQVRVGSSQVTLVPTIWFLYDDKRWEKDTRRFVAELEWLSGEGFGSPEVQKGCPRFTNLRIPVKKLLLSDAGQDSISLPDGGKLYIHVEEPQSSTACGLLYCATFVQDGEVSAQYVSRIGGLMDLDARTAAITTAHGFVEEISSRANRLSTGDDTESDEEPELNDDDESLNSQDSECYIGRIDSGILDTVSWFQVSPASIQETCFFGLDGSTIHDLVMNSRRQREKAASDVPAWQLSAAALPTEPPETSQTGDFSLLSLNDKDKLYNYYQSVEDKAIETETVVNRLAEPQEIKTGPVHLLLRPGKTSQAILLPGTMLFSPYNVALQAYKVFLDDPLAPGCSGTWVVQEGLLYGMIIASYEYEPFAVMLPSYQISRDIRGHFPYVSTIRLPGVRDGIWDHDLTLPGTSLKQSHQSHTQNQAQPKGSDVEMITNFHSTDSRSRTTRPSTEDRISQSTTSLTSIDASTEFRHNFHSLNQVFDAGYDMAVMTGPPFGETTNSGTLFCTGAIPRIPVTISILAVINSGFFLEDGGWTSYRPNHFTCTCSYRTSPRSFQTVYLEDPRNGRCVKVQKFVMGVSGVTFDSEPHDVEIIQHPAGREKEPAVTPRTVILRPNQTTAPSAWKTMPTEHRFERLQFKPTPLNDKRMEIQQHYSLVIELWADIGDGQQLIRVASVKSAKLTVRGRLPGHYQSEGDDEATTKANENVPAAELKAALARYDAFVLGVMKKRRMQKRLERSRVQQGAREVGSTKEGASGGRKPGNGGIEEKEMYVKLRGFVM